MLCLKCLCPPTKAICFPGWGRCSGSIIFVGIVALKTTSRIFFSLFNNYLDFGTLGYFDLNYMDSIS